MTILIILTACGSSVSLAGSNATATPAFVDTPTPYPPIQPTLIATIPGAASPTPTPDGLPTVAAQHLLASQLGINPDQVQTIGIDPTDWPDTCLGIQLPGIMCAQHVVPGYKILLEANNHIYEYHTGQNGSDPVIVPSLNITWQTGQTCNTADIRYDQDVQFGICGGTSESAPLADPHQADQLLEFYQSYAPFSAQTPAGQINFNSVGQRQASPAEQRMIAEWARQVVTQASGGSIDAALGLVISWHHEGGSTNNCGDLAIYVTGEVDATACEGATPLEFGQTFLYSDQLEQLYTWVDTLKSFDLNRANPAADGESVHLIFNGAGIEDAPADQMQAIQDFAAQVYLQADHWHAAVKAERSPEQVVSDFLTTIEKDPSGNSSLSDLGQFLSAEVQSGHPLPGLLGIENAYRSFGIRNVTINEAGDHVRVDAGLNYVSPVNRSFILTQDSDNNWQISTFITYAVPALAIPDNTAGAESAILSYVQAIQDHQPQTAWSWLSDTAQQQSNLADLAVQSNSIEQISLTTIKLIADSQGSLIYAANLWVQSSASNVNTWQTGENQRWFSLVNTDFGWRIDQVSSQPLG